MLTRCVERFPTTTRGACAAVVTATLLLIECGCAFYLPHSVTPLSVPVDVPAAWSATDAVAAADATSLAQWWQRFDDPLLGTLVNQALRANTSVNTAQAALKQAGALRDVAAASLWPTVVASASAQHTTTGGHSNGNSFQAGADGRWVPDIFGANHSALRAAEATVEASSASLGDIQVLVAAEVGLSYITLRSAQTRLTIASENLAIEEETLQIAQWREQAGLGSSLEAEQARGQTEQTRALLPALRTNIGQASHALAVLTGQPPAALSTLLAAVRPVPTADDDVALSIPAETLRQRPDVRAAERQMAAALARVDQARAARAPSFALGGSLGLSALTLGTLTSGASAVSALVASTAVPVFDGGAARAQVRAQQAALEQAQLAYQAGVLAALQDVEDALIALDGDRNRLLSLRNAADAATNASLLARQRYRSGLVDFQTVLDTQRTQLGTQDGVASASADVSADHVRLFKALGGGWRPENPRIMPGPTEDVSRKSPP
jgi:multidrug efflux system outer membrane protein